MLPIDVAEVVANRLNWTREMLVEACAQYAEANMLATRNVVEAT